MNPGLALPVRAGVVSAVDMAGVDREAEAVVEDFVAAGEGGEVVDLAALEAVDRVEAGAEDTVAAAVAAMAAAAVVVAMAGECLARAIPKAEAIRSLQCSGEYSEHIQWRSAKSTAHWFRKTAYENRCADAFSGDVRWSAG
jgi:hypothetical protein